MTVLKDEMPELQWGQQGPTDGARLRQAEQLDSPFGGVPGTTPVGGSPGSTVAAHRAGTPLASI